MHLPPIFLIAPFAPCSLLPRLWGQADSPTTGFAFSPARLGLLGSCLVAVANSDSVDVCRQRTVTDTTVNPWVMYCDVAMLPVEDPRRPQTVSVDWSPVLPPAAGRFVDCSLLAVATDAGNVCVTFTAIHPVWRACASVAELVTEVALPAVPAVTSVQWLPFDAAACGCGVQRLTLALGRINGSVVIVHGCLCSGAALADGGGGGGGGSSSSSSGGYADTFPAGVCKAHNGFPYHFRVGCVLGPIDSRRVDCLTWAPHGLPVRRDDVSSDSGEAPVAPCLAIGAATRLAVWSPGVAGWAASCAGNVDPGSDDTEVTLTNIVVVLNAHVGVMSGLGWFYTDGNPHRYVYWVRGGGRLNDGVEKPVSSLRVTGCDRCCDVRWAAGRRGRRNMYLRGV